MKDITGYEGKYAITEDGRVWSYPKRQHKGKFLKEGDLIVKGKASGYKLVVLSKGKAKGFLAHRLVALTYLPNPQNKRTVNHKNSIRDDNRVENLEWCTHKENMIHAFADGKNKSTNFGKFGGNAARAKTVVHKDSEDVIRRWSCIMDCAEELGISAQTISNYCKNKKEEHGYIWSFGNNF